MRFRRETRCVTALYERLFGKLKTDGAWKVLVEGVGYVHDPSVRNLLGVMTVEVAFDEEKYWSSSPDRKKSIALSTLMVGIRRVAVDQGWDAEPFNDAARLVENQQFRNEWILRSPKWNSQRRYRAAVKCVHDIDRFKAWLTVSDRGGREVATRLAVDDLPDEFVFAPKLGSLEWVNEMTVRLLSTSGQEVASLAVSSPDS